MAFEPLVGIHPHKAAALADALRVTATTFSRASAAAQGALVEAMEDTEPVRPVLGGVEWFDDQARVLQGMLDAIWHDEVVGGGTSFEGVVWRAPYADAFDHPAEARRAADAAVAMVPSGLVDASTDELAAFARHVERWHDDPVFAVLFAAAHPPVDLADLLRHVPELWSATPDDQHRQEERRAVEAVFASAATASRFAILPWRIDDVAGALASDAGRARRADGTVDLGSSERSLLAGLFTVATAWGDQELIDATTAIVLPMNGVARQQGVPQSRVGESDARALVLGSVARNRVAARRVLTELPLDDLLSTANTYDDGGRALGQVLVAATAPGTGDDVGAARAMRSLVVWTAAHRDLPPHALEQLGPIVVPYLAAFRSPLLDDDTAIANPLPGLSWHERDSIITYATTDERSAVVLRTGELTWAAEQVRRLGDEHYDGRGIAVLASVDGQVADAAATLVIEQYTRADERDSVARGVLLFVVGLVAGYWPGSTFVSNFVALAAQQAVERASPPPKLLERYAEGARADRRRDEALFEQLVIATLWERRADNHVFDAVPLPAEALEGEPPRLKSLATLSADEDRRFAEWKHDPRVKAATHWQELAEWGR
jgi:hypothetical protein